MGAIQNLPRRGILVKLIQRCPLYRKRLEKIGTQVQRGFQKLSSLTILPLLEIRETEIVVNLGRLGIKAQGLTKGLDRIPVTAKLTK